MGSLGDAVASGDVHLSDGNPLIRWNAIRTAYFDVIRTIGIIIM